MKGKSHKTFTIILSTKSVFCKFRFGCPPPVGRCLLLSSILMLRFIFHAAYFRFSHQDPYAFPCVSHAWYMTAQIVIFTIQYSSAFSLAVTATLFYPDAPPTLFSQHPRSIILFSVWRVAAFFFDHFESTPLKRDYSHHHSSLLSAEY